MLAVLMEEASVTGDDGVESVYATDKMDGLLGLTEDIVIQSNSTFAVRVGVQRLLDSSSGAGAMIVRGLVTMCSAAGSLEVVRHIFRAPST